MKLREPLVPTGPGHTFTRPEDYDLTWERSIMSAKDKES